MQNFLDFLSEKISFRFKVYLLTTYVYLLWLWGNGGFKVFGF